MSNNLTCFTKQKRQEVWNKGQKLTSSPRLLAIKDDFLEETLNNLSKQEQVATSRINNSHTNFILLYPLNKHDITIYNACNSKITVGYLIHYRIKMCLDSDLISILRAEGSNRSFRNKCKSTSIFLMHPESIKSYNI